MTVNVQGIRKVQIIEKVQLEIDINLAGVLSEFLTTINCAANPSKQVLAKGYSNPKLVEIFGLNDLDPSIVNSLQKLTKSLVAAVETVCDAEDYDEVEYSYSDTDNDKV